MNDIEQTWVFTFKPGATDPATGQSLAGKGMRCDGTEASARKRVTDLYGGFQIAEQMTQTEYELRVAEHQERIAAEIAEIAEAAGVTAWTLKHPADGSGRWMVSGEHGTVQYDVLGPHLTVHPAGGELDAVGKRWADEVGAYAADGDIPAVFRLLVGHYQTLTPASAR